MRELTKSLFSFSWVMSLFGLQSVVNLAHPSKTMEAFDAVTKAATSSFEGITLTTYQTGDRLQRQMVDAAFGALPANVLDPVGMVRMTTDLFRKSADAVTQTFRETGGGANTPSGESNPNAGKPNSAQGWGPMGGVKDRPSESTPPSQSKPESQPQPKTPPSEGWGPMPDTGGKR
jgi:hypothetical protein